MHSHHSAEPKAPLWKKLVGVIPVIGPLIAKPTVSQKLDASIGGAVNIAGQIVGMKKLPNFEINFFNNMTTNMFINMSAKMWVGSSAANILYAIASKPVKLIPQCADTSPPNENVLQWIKRVIPGNLPLFGSFFTAKTNKLAVAQMFQEICMILNGAAAMMFMTPETEDEREHFIASNGMMIVGMLLSDMVWTIGTHYYLTDVPSEREMTEDGTSHELREVLLQSPNPS